MSVEGAIGAIVGFAVGGPSGAQWGYAIGSAVGGSDAPDQEGPRLNDLQIQDSSYGKPIPIVYGMDRFAGNIIWSKPLEEVKNEESAGKGGGPTSTTYNYFASFALGLCEGEILGVRRIWADSKLIYKMAEDGSTEEILASKAQLDGITIYTGSESQDPDPLIQADKGAANTPAFRGLAYLVFDRLDVGNSGRIPNITVEVIGSGSTEIQGKMSEFLLPKTAFSVGGAQRYYPLYHLNDGVFRVYSAANLSSAGDSGLDLATYERVDEVDLSGNLIKLGVMSDNSSLSPSGQDALINSTQIIRQANAQKVGVYNNSYVWFTGSTSTAIASGGKVIQYGLYVDLLSDIVSGQDLTELLVDAGATGEYVRCATGCISDDAGGLSTFYVFTAASAISTYSLTKYYQFEINAGAWEITETGTISGGNHETFNALGLLNQPSGACVLEDENHLWYCGSLLSSTVISYGEKVGTHWTIYSSEGGTFPNAPLESGTGGGRFSVVAKDGICIASDGTNVRIYSRNLVLSSSELTLSTIVTDLCERAGLTASDIDVTDLTDTVAGYTVSRVTSARKAIEPLMMAYFFDGAEFNNKLNFIKRGGATVLTIPENDLGVDSEDLYKHTRQQEAELPSEVILDYKDENRDYQPGSQRSRRINTHVTNVAQVSAPIVMSNNKAKRIAEIHHYNSWVERDRFFLQVTQEYIDLNPTDVIQFTAEGDTRKARIVDISYGPMMKLELAAESGNYESDAVAGESESVDQTLGLIGPTNLQLLDIPLLRNQDNDTAIYAAASGYYNGWTGCRVFKSADDVSYQEVDNLFETITQGYTTSTLADANHTTWDRTSTVTVKWTAGSAPASITESNALKGSRYFLIGDEIVVPVNETDNGDGTYTYDTFLRGRRGTDWATSEHETGERVILLDEAKMSRLEMVLSTQRYFKGVSIGNYLANAESETFTNTGVSLKPFSPTFIRGTRDGSNNLTITWINRSRYIGGALMPLPLFEDSESYKVEILDAPGGSVIRTLSPNPTTTTDTYSAADQTSDGLTLGDPVTVRISQYSATVGYGYTKEATV